MKDDPECKHLLTGIEAMGEKEQYKAHKCFTQCIFQERKLFVAGELVEKEIRNFNEEFLNDNGGEDFIDITKNSTDYCFEECESVSLSTMRF